MGDSKFLSSSIPTYPVSKALHLSCVQSFAWTSLLHKLSEFQLTVAQYWPVRDMDTKQKGPNWFPVSEG